MDDKNFSENLKDFAQAPAVTTDASIEAYITNLGRYNEGALVGKWHPFPTTPEAIAATFQEIGIDGVRYEEFFVTDYQTTISGLYDMLPEYASLNELNYLATQLENMQNYEISKLEAVLQSGEVSGLQDVINLTEGSNLDDCYDFIPDIDDDEDLGYYWIEESGTYDLSSMGNLARYFDYESFGRDVRIDEGGSFVDGGYIRATGDSMDEIYDGIDVPDEYKVSSLPGNDQPEKPESISVLLVKPDAVPETVEMENTLKALQEAVGGRIEAAYPFDDPVALVCNEEGKLDGLPLNRAIYDEDGQMVDIIAGDFTVCGLTDDNFGSLPPDLLEKYAERFKHPEQFVKIAGQIVAVKQPVKDAGDPDKKMAEKPKQNGPEL